MHRFVGLCLVVFATGLATAQQSASYYIESYTFSPGGRPSGVPAQSASFRLSLEAVGQAGSVTGLGSASYGLDAGFPTAFAPVGEVRGVRFTAPDRLEWDPVSGALSYDVYGDSSGSLPGGPADCLAPNVVSTYWIDEDTPLLGATAFYLPVAVNRLGEAGTLGYTSEGTQRSNGTPCP